MPASPRSASSSRCGPVLRRWGAYVRTITIAYDMPHLRSAWKGRLLAFGLYLGALAVGAVLLPVLVLGPDLLIDLAPAGSLTQAASTLIELGYWPAVALASILALASLYHLSVPVRSPWRRDLPGAALAMVLWVTGSFGLRAYLESTAKYGVLSAPIGVLLFFFVTALAVLLGAELNAEIDKMWPTASTSDGRRRSRHNEPLTAD
jgi:membrane protein